MPDTRKADYTRVYRNWLVRMWRAPTPQHNLAVAESKNAARQQGFSNRELAIARVNARLLYERTQAEGGYY